MIAGAAPIPPMPSAASNWRRRGERRQRHDQQAEQRDRRDRLQQVQHRENRPLPVADAGRCRDAERKRRSATAGRPSRRRARYAAARAAPNDMPARVWNSRASDSASNIPACAIDREPGDDDHRRAEHRQRPGARRAATRRQPPAPRRRAGPRTRRRARSAPASSAVAASDRRPPVPQPHQEQQQRRGSRAMPRYSARRGGGEAVAEQRHAERRGSRARSRRSQRRTAPTGFPERSRFGATATKPPAATATAATTASGEQRPGSARCTRRSRQKVLRCQVVARDRAGVLAVDRDRAFSDCSVSRPRLCEDRVERRRDLGMLRRARPARTTGAGA